MLRYVPRNGINTLFCLIHLVGTTEFLFHIGTLCISHPLANTVEIPINGICVYLLWYHTTLIKQWHNSTIFYSLIYGINRLNDTTKFCRSTLLLLHQRRTGHSNEASIRQHLLHLYSHLTILAAVSLVNQHKDIRVGEWSFQSSYRCLKLVYDGRNHRRTCPFQQLYKVTARCGILYAYLAFAKCRCNLSVEVGTVSYKDDARVTDRFIKHNCLRQQHHCQWFARALRVPNDTTSTFTSFDIAYSLHYLLNSKKLLIACHLLYAVII